MLNLVQLKTDQGIKIILKKEFEKEAANLKVTTTIHKEKCETLKQFKTFMMKTFRYIKNNVEFSWQDLFQISEGLGCVS